jgi:hypothetical protein
MVARRLLAVMSGLSCLGCRGKTSISTEGRPGFARPFSTSQGLGWRRS